MLLDEIEAHARTKFAGDFAEADAAKSFELPKSISDLNYFRSCFHEIAMAVWYRELKLQKK